MTLVARKLAFAPLAAMLTAGLLAAAVPTGPEIGARVPDFHLHDQNGSERNLRSIMGSKGAYLVFFRSADW